MPALAPDYLALLARLDRIRSLGVVPVEADLLRAGRRLRHDSRKLGKALLSVVAGQG